MTQVEVLETIITTVYYYYYSGTWLLNQQISK
jgi:hypothetical protein